MEDDDELSATYVKALSADETAKLKEALKANLTKKTGQLPGENDKGDEGEPNQAGSVSDAASEAASHLKKDQGRQPSADNARKHLDERRKAEIDRLETDNKQRKAFFRFMLFVAAVPVAVSSGVMVRLSWDGDVGDSVVIAFFVSVVVEVLGLAVIVANYLFPKRGSLPEDKEIWKEPDD